ncbi:uncharacterized protein LOC135826691 [Sycon ciliatum]|uniref:uncharacterized protein LOC135826691 n=1 Tax=Sycon ciliatum TaxID=27933 RepID=UPI0031F69AFD
MACGMGQIAIAKHLVKCKAKVDKTDDNGDLPVHSSASEGHLEVVKYLLELQPDTISVQDSNGLLPVHHAASSGQLEVVKYLLDLQPDTISAMDNMSSQSSPTASEFIRFKLEHDLHLLLVVMGKPNTFGRGSKDWDEIAESMRKTFGDMRGLTARTCKERTIREIRSFVVNDNKSKRRSGTEEEFTRKDELLTELASRWRAAEDEKVEAGKAKKTKNDGDAVNGAKLREAALQGMRSKNVTPVKRNKITEDPEPDSDGSDDSGDSSLSETEHESAPTPKKPEKRKRATNGSGRRGGSVGAGLLDWLERKTNAEMDLHKRELALKEREMALREKELELKMRSQ